MSPMCRLLVAPCHSILIHPISKNLSREQPLGERESSSCLPGSFCPPPPFLCACWIVRELEEGGHESELEYSNYSSVQSSQDGSPAQGFGQPHGSHTDLSSNHSSSLQLNEHAQVTHFSKPWDPHLRELKAVAHITLWLNKLKYGKNCHSGHHRCLRNAAAAAKSRQSCLTLCDSIDGSPPGSPIRNASYHYYN